MKCSDCSRAAVNPRTGRYTANCAGCSARALAQAPAFFDAIQAEAITDRYRDALQMVFGSGWKDGHEMVKAFAKRLKGST